MRRRRRGVDDKQPAPVAVITVRDTAQEQRTAPQDSVDAPPPADMPEHVPAHVWHLLQRSGEKAAEKLLDILTSASWAKLPTATQLRVIDLALTRAYGPPIKREVSVALTGKVSDATSDALAAMSGQPLPEYRHHTSKGRADDAIDVTPEGSDYPDKSDAS